MKKSIIALSVAVSFNVAADNGKAGFHLGLEYSVNSYDLANAYFISDNEQTDVTLNFGHTWIKDSGEFDRLIELSGHYGLSSEANIYDTTKIDTQAIGVSVYLARSVGASRNTFIGTEFGLTNTSGDRSESAYGLTAIAETDFTSFSLAGRVDHYFTDSFSIGGKLGFALVNGDLTATMTDGYNTISDSVSPDGPGVVMGINTKYTF
ncbi:hypothetical protein [Vibrio crassostreae]|uniref:hypothetical protein n=1 Tax=Vibrio crassostreae TaxID=246167 RepID=UPI0006366CF9|nr:hypothetical protein [Vibrio crassostreae]TCN86118.1 hypothetical protein EDB65_105116 [Vibrio crassostreae]TCO04834.1 hypothetical protein EDB30_103382 [Vibrio crassostreae]TQK40212.1 hypothetical protein FB441_0829 [Vibrio crassostreae]CAK1986951.1 Outer membrane protein beta-barrel domain-containing protein [Vibrio crassostreae]CAK1988796.1 Outer membrane protein beta-barrel domain-containing protein [Vibrio crassostreae]